MRIRILAEVMCAKNSDANDANDANRSLGPRERFASFASFASLFFAHMTSARMRILIVNWQDRENPQAGGAEIHLHEIFGRLAQKGHDVTLLCGGWPDSPPTATLDG